MRASSLPPASNSSLARSAAAACSALGVDKGVACGDTWVDAMVLLLPVLCMLDWGVRPCKQKKPPQHEYIKIIFDLHHWELRANACAH